MDTDQYLCILRLSARYTDESAWTEYEHGIVAAHFDRLVEANKSGSVTFVGRTTNEPDKRIGIYVIDSMSEYEANEFAKNDPTVLNGIMNCEIYPFKTVLERH
jgi:uncharacterized protein YciI